MESAITYENVVHALVRAVPELEELLSVHRADYGEVLPHVFFGDVTRFLVERAIGRSTHEDVLVRALEMLERASASTDSRVAELVHASICENLEDSSPEYSTIRALLGPRMMATMSQIERFHKGL